MPLRNLRAVVAAAGAGTLLSLSVAVPALAAPPVNGRPYATHGNDYASIDPHGLSKTWVEVCDMEWDGNPVWAWFQGNPGQLQQVHDTNGSAGGCGNVVLNFRVTQFWVVEFGSPGAITTVP